MNEISPSGDLLDSQPKLPVWNWGAFFLTWIWGYRLRYPLTWVLFTLQLAAALAWGLLTFLPYSLNGGCSLHGGLLYIAVPTLLLLISPASMLLIGFWAGFALGDLSIGLVSLALLMLLSLYAIRGYRMTWANSRLKDFNQVRAEQRRWAWVGLGVTLVVVVAWVFLGSGFSKQYCQYFNSCSKSNVPASTVSCYLPAKFAATSRIKF